MAKVIIKEELCKACGLCVHFCPEKILEFGLKLNKLGYRYVVVREEDSCKTCLRCALICPETCIEIYKKIETPEGPLTG